MANKQKTEVETESQEVQEVKTSDSKKEKAKAKKTEKEKIAKEKMEALTFTKRFIIFVMINAEIQIYLSYILGFLGKENIAETLSTQVVITVLGAIGFYCVKALIENLHKYPGGTLFAKPINSEDIQED